MKEKNLLFSNSDYIFAYFFSMGDGFARNSLAFFPAHKKFFFPRRFYLALLQLGWFRLLPLKGLLFCLCELFWAVFNPIENWNSTERRKKSKQVNKRRNWATSRFAQLMRQRASCMLWRKCTVLARTDCCSYRCLCCASMELFHVEIPPWKFFGRRWRKFFARRGNFSEISHFWNSYRTRIHTSCIHLMNSGFVVRQMFSLRERQRKSHKSLLPPGVSFRYYFITSRKLVNLHFLRIFLGILLPNHYLLR